MTTTTLNSLNVSMFSFSYNCLMAKFDLIIAFELFKYMYIE
jgi:hypothetical protein